MPCAAQCTSAFRHSRDPITPSFMVGFLPHKGKLSTWRSQAWLPLPLCHASVQAGMATRCTPGGDGTPRKVGPQGQSQVSHIL